MAIIRRCDYKDYGIIINIKISLHFQKHTKSNEEEINELEM